MSGRRHPGQIYSLVDVLDRPMRLSYYREEYREPESSLLEWAREIGLRIQWRGNIAFINEREYIEALKALPTTKNPKSAKPDAREDQETRPADAARGDDGRPTLGEDPLPDEGRRTTRLRRGVHNPA